MVTKYDGKYIVDGKGKPVSVLLNVRLYRKMLAAVEELDAIRAYDAAKNSPDEAIPFEQAVLEIEKSRR